VTIRAIRGLLFLLSVSASLRFKSVTENAVWQD
jgi:hypothetical protein